jgi:sugar phosphate isomerase/epimerase
MRNTYYKFYKPRGGLQLRRMGIGLQLYTVREDTAKDFRGTLRQISKMGYEGVEFAGYGDIPADEMKTLLDELNLKAIGSHISLDNLENNLQAEINYLKTIGGRYAICPFLLEPARENEAAWKQTIEKLNSIGDEVTKQGLQFAYHNHAFEFEDRIDGEFVFDVIYNVISTAKVEMDIGWVQYAGQDPLAYIHKYEGRLPLLHLKDYRQGQGDKIDTVELGKGDLKLNDIIQAASDANVEWIIVEQDTCANPPLESVETSMKWLESHYLNQFIKA